MINFIISLILFAPPIPYRPNFEHVYISRAESESIVNLLNADGGLPDSVKVLRMQISSEPDNQMLLWDYEAYVFFNNYLNIPIPNFPFILE